LIAAINGQLGRPVGFVHAALYRIGTPAFRDISKGSNGGYQASNNWDPCTGFGSPNGAALLKALQGSATMTAS
jgi:kumamolisin